MRSSEEFRNAAADAQLVRGLRRWDLVALVVNSVIGAGIFGLPSRVFALAGTWSLLAYVVSATAIALIIMCFAEVSSRFRDTGGPYLYARTAFGPLIGFQVGWLMWLGRIAAFAALANLFVGYLGHFVPGAGGPTGRIVVIVAAVLLLAATNIVGVRVTATVTNVLTVGKLLPLLLVGVGGLFFIEPARYTFAAPPAYHPFAQAALLLAFTYMGFEGAVIPTGEARDPARHLPFALLTGIAVVATVYMLVQVACIGTLPELAASQRPLVDAGVRFLGAPGASVIAAGALVSIGGTLNALMFASPRLPFAMAERRQLPQALTAIHRRFRTPVPAILLTALVTLGLTLFTTFISALTISAVARLLGYSATCAALPVLRRHPALPRPAFRLRGGDAVAVAALGLIAWFLWNTPAAELRVVAVAIVIGLALYFALARR